MYNYFCIMFIFICSVNIVNAEEKPPIFRIKSGALIKFDNQHKVYWTTSLHEFEEDEKKSYQLLRIGLVDKNPTETEKADYKLGSIFFEIKIQNLKECIIGIKEDNWISVKNGETSLKIKIPYRKQNSN